MTRRHILALSHSHTHIGRTSFRQPGLELTWQTCNFYLGEESCFGTMGIFHSEGASAVCPPFCIHNCQSCVAALTWWISSFWLFLALSLLLRSWSVCCFRKSIFYVTWNVNTFATRHAFPRSVLTQRLLCARKQKKAVRLFLPFKTWLYGHNTGMRRLFSASL